MKKRLSFMFVPVFILLLFLIQPTESNAETVSSGVFGDDLTWTLDGGTLRVSGNGSMGTMTFAPWDDRKDEIVHVEILPGVTTIADAAFSQCHSLTSASLPDTLGTIGSYAFSSCDSLSEITIPDSVTVLKYAAFSWCGALKKVTLSKNITQIDSYTFQECASLTGIIIPEGVTNVALWSFYNCASLSSMTLPASLKRIGYFAFYGTGLQSVYYGGSPSDWDGIDIGPDNPDLRTARLYYNGGKTVPGQETAELQMADTNYGSAQTGYRFRVRLTGTIHGSVLAALYMRGGSRMTALSIVPASQDLALPFDSGTAGSYAKLMWLDDDLRPLCAAVRVELDGGEIPGPVTLEDLLDTSRSEVFEDGDVVYQPEEAHLAFDEDGLITYYDNLLTVFLTREFAPEELRVMLDSVDGTLVTYLSGAVDLLQITVSPTDLPHLKDLAAQIAAMDGVLDADYEIPMEIGADTAADLNPWPLGGYEEEDRGNEERPDGWDWWAEKIRAYTAWSYDELSGNVTVGILDNGFDTDHEDLSGQMEKLHWYSRQSEAEHGTMVAGIIAAKNNAVGIRGVADRAKLIYVDTAYKDNDILKDVSNGKYIKYMSSMIEEKGAAVINLSWGFSRDAEDKYLQDHPGTRTEDYVRKAREWDAAAEKHAKKSMMLMISLLLNRQDFLIVESAGNGLKHVGMNSDSDAIEAVRNGYFCGITEDLYTTFLKSLEEEQPDLLYQIQSKIPFQSLTEHIMVVGATDQDDMMTNMSNYGRQVSITAPGLLILSTLPNNEYYWKDGTSLAAPMVSGAAALLRSMDPSLSMTEVRSILLRTARQNAAVGVGVDAGSTYPILDVGAAVESIACHISIRVQDESGVLLPGASVRITDRSGSVRNAAYDKKTGCFTVGILRGPFSFEISLDGYQRDSGSADTDTTAFTRTLSADPRPGDAVTFNGHSYKVYDPMTWDEARIYCEAQGGHLVTLTSPEEQDLIASYISYLDQGYVWIGMREPWEQWVTGEPVSYTNWGLGEPDDLGNMQPYGCMLTNGEYRGSGYHIGAGEWDDWQGPKTYFVCEWDTPDGYRNANACGDHAVWELKDGVLTVSGTGSMWDHYNDAAEVSFRFADDTECTSSAPWFEMRDQIREVVVDPGITELGSGAFLRCTDLMKVSLPDGLIHTKICAFRGCTSLSAIELPATLQTIDTSCFQGCTSLQEVRIPEGDLWGVGHLAFFRCPALRSVTLPSSVTFIGSYSFEEGLDPIQICYGGTAEQWREIRFDAHNDAVKRASVVYQ